MIEAIKSIDDIVAPKANLRVMWPLAKPAISASKEKRRDMCPVARTNFRAKMSLSKDRAISPTLFVLARLSPRWWKVVTLAVPSAANDRRLPVSRSLELA